MAVSYTHLDVYKRQSLDIVLQYKVSEVQDMDQVMEEFEDTIKTACDKSFKKRTTL